MNLLYCLNEIVTSMHDDSEDVLLSTYPAGTRIIPYDLTLDTLDKFGAAPPAMGNVLPNPPDSRPYQQPAETNHLLQMYSSQCRYNYVTGGFTYTALDSSTIPVATDRTSQALLANLAQYCTTIAPTDPIDFTQNGVHYPLTAQDAININNQFNAAAQAYRTCEASCLADLNAQTPTLATYDDVDAKFTTVAASRLRKT